MDALKKLFSNPAVKEALRILLAALAGYLGSGCSALTGANHPAMDVIACKVAVLAPVVGDGAEALAREIDGNQAFSPVKFLLAQGVTPDDILKIAEAYQACEPRADAAPLPLEQG